MPEIGVVSIDEAWGILEEVFTRQRYILETIATALAVEGLTADDRTRLLRVQRRIAHEVVTSAEDVVRILDVP